MVKKIGKVENKIYEKICPHCNRRFASMYKTQLEFNFKVHTENCGDKNDN